MKERGNAHRAVGTPEASRKRVTYAKVMSTIAVFGVLGTGGAYAASKIGPKDIKKNAVRAKHIKKNQLRAKHIKDGAVTEAKLADGLEGLQGPKGDRGPKGNPGEDAPEAWALVSFNGTLLQGSGVTAVAESTAYQGQYEVTFATPNARDACAVVAHPNHQSGSTALNNDAVDVSAETLRTTIHSGGRLSEVIVAFHDAANANKRPLRFSVAAFC